MPDLEMAEVLSPVWMVTFSPLMMSSNLFGIVVALMSFLSPGVQ